MVLDVASQGVTSFLAFEEQFNLVKLILSDESEMIDDDDEVV